MNDQQLQESFDAMKAAFAATIRGIAPQESAEAAIAALAQIVGIYNCTTNDLECVFASKSHWFVHYRPEPGNKTFIFMWNVEGRTHNHICVDVLQCVPHIYFIEGTRFLIVQLPYTSCVREFDLDTMEWLDDYEISMLPQHLVVQNNTFITPIAAKNPEHVLLFDSGKHSIGILNLRTREMLHTQELPYGDYSIYTNEDIIVAEFVSRSPKRKRTWTVLGKYGYMLIKLAFLVVYIDIKRVEFCYAPSIKHVSISLIPEQSYNNVILTVPRKPQGFIVNNLFIIKPPGLIQSGLFLFVGINFGLIFFSTSDTCYACIVARSIIPHYISDLPVWRTINLG